jgi:outer membrane protein assembly factor BamB
MKRISIGVLIFSACFMTLTWSQMPVCKVDTPWAEFHRYNMRRSNPCEKVLNVSNVGNLVLKWSYTTGRRVLTSPAVESGVVYVGSDDKNLWALNADTGTKLWTYATGGVVESDPAVAGGVVYVGSSDYNVYALNARTGAKLWSYTTGYIVDSAPAVANG